MCRGYLEAISRLHLEAISRLHLEAISRLHLESASRKCISAASRVASGGDAEPPQRGEAVLAQREERRLIRAWLMAQRGVSRRGWLSASSGAVTPKQTAGTRKSADLFTAVGVKRLCSHPADSGHEEVRGRGWRGAGGVGRVVHLCHD